MEGQQDVPLACTLTGRAYDDRLSWIAELNRDGLRSHRRLAESLELHYATHARARVEELVRRESACCAFLAFSLEESPDGVRLTVAVPPRAAALADELLGPFLTGQRR